MQMNIIQILVNVVGNWSIRKGVHVVVSYKIQIKGKQIVILNIFRIKKSYLKIKRALIV